MKENEGAQCLRVPLLPKANNAVAWEAFSGAVDQWNMNGGYDFTLAIKLMEIFGLAPPEILEGIEKIRVIVNKLQEVTKADSKSTNGEGEDEDETSTGNRRKGWD